MTNKRVAASVGWGLTVLVALMPIHAFAVITLGHVFGHQTIWAAWKELVLLIMAVACVYLVITDPDRFARLKQPVVYLMGAFVIVGAIVTLIAHPSFTNAAIGAKTDFEFLLAAVIALIVATPALIRRLVIVFLASSAVVVMFGLLQATILPHDLLSSLGYGNAPGQTAAFETVLVGAHAVYRFGSTLGGPNQLGTFLILPLTLSLILGLKRRWWWLYSAAILPVLFVTYSRGAWIGAAVAVAVLAVVQAPPRQRLWVGSGLVTIGLVVSGLTLFSPDSTPLANYFHHSATAGALSSDSQHVSSIRAGASQLFAQPLGHGLGTAGPATFHAGTTNIIEDNYLQIGFETGILGLLLFVGIIVGLIIRLLSTPSNTASIAIASAIIGISLTAIVLPAWTDSSTALTVWTFAGASLGARYV